MRRKIVDELAMGERGARRIQELVDGMSGGDPRAMEAFFTFVSEKGVKKPAQPRKSTTKTETDKPAKENARAGRKGLSR